MADGVVATLTMGPAYRFADWPMPDVPARSAYRRIGVAGASVAGGRREPVLRLRGEGELQRRVQPALRARAGPAPSQPAAPVPPATGPGSAEGDERAPQGRRDGR